MLKDSGSLSPYWGPRKSCTWERSFLCSRRRLVPSCSPVFEVERRARTREAFPACRHALQIQRLHAEAGQSWCFFCHTPQGFKPVVPMESPALIFGTPTKLTSDSSSAVEYLGKNKIPELQKLFQKPDGVPVHLKRGVPDKLLYRTTMALTIGGTIYCLIALYMAAHPKRQK